ncbi:type II toxin-antitoxin system prevent-host-death family antitoxin [Neorhizobium sp. DT-125]|uniref:type II toxin-antitoxin system prevent-host-death family antitoxin n=1 Tax=Neorhizobium sp. DT-125 TaxID=3396163 RepID=UPI003F1CED45
MRHGQAHSTSNRKSGDIIAEASRHSVTITQRSKPHLVLLNIEDYERLKRRADPRSAGTLETMPDALFAEFQEAVEGYANEGEGTKP